MLTDLRVFFDTRHRAKGDHEMLDDSEMLYTDKALLQREAVKFDPAVQRVLKELTFSSKLGWQPGAWRSGRKTTLTVCSVLQRPSSCAAELADAAAPSPSRQAGRLGQLRGWWKSNKNHLK